MTTFVVIDVVDEEEEAINCPTAQVVWEWREEMIRVNGGVEDFDNDDDGCDEIGEGTKLSSCCWGVNDEVFKLLSSCSSCCCCCERSEMNSIFGDDEEKYKLKKKTKKIQIKTVRTNLALLISIFFFFLDI